MERKGGFNSDNEEKFLRRFAPEKRQQNLRIEISTQLAEDFGVLEHTKEYVLNGENKIVDPESELTLLDIIKGGGEKYWAEVRAVEIIEYGLKNNPEKMIVNFSPANEELGYTENFVDIWRLIDNESGKRVILNRLRTVHNFEGMKNIRESLGGKESINDEMELLSQPIATDLKLGNLLEVFKLAEEYKNGIDYKKIYSTVQDFIEQFKKSGKLSDNLTSEEISRLYSAAYDFLDGNNVVLSRQMLNRYLYQEMMFVEKKSFGCAGVTRVGQFAEGRGMVVSVVDGSISVKEGNIDGLCFCKHCGCYYSGDKCPICN
jgi:hypothetical protein